MALELVAAGLGFVAAEVDIDEPALVAAALVRRAAVLPVGNVEAAAASVVPASEAVRAPVRLRVACRGGMMCYQRMTERVKYILQKGDIVGPEKKSTRRVRVV